MRPTGHRIRTEAWDIKINAHTITKTNNFICYFFAYKITSFADHVCLFLSDKERDTEGLSFFNRICGTEMYFLARGQFALKR